MFSLTKQQVKSLLEVISKDDNRQVLQQVKIDIFNDEPVLVATDSFRMAILRLSEAMLPEVGKMIDRSEIVKWYKLANNKSFFTETDLIDLPSTSFVGKYPEWQRLVPKREAMLAQESISMNIGYLLDLGKLAGNTGMVLEFYGKLSPVVSRIDGNIYILMPLKI